MLPIEKRLTTKAQLKEWVSYESKLYGGKGYSVFPVFEKNKLLNHVILLRHSEYHLNNGNKLRYMIFHYLLRSFQMKYSLSIPENVFAKGLHIVHLCPIIVNPGAVCGEDIQLLPYAGIVAGRKSTKDNYDAPILGNGCALSIGSVVTGGVTLADNIVVGANSVVNKSFTEPDIAVAGVPARKISDNGRSVWKSKKEKTQGGAR